MKFIKKWNPRGTKILPEFKGFKKVVKNVKRLNTWVNSDSLLKKAIKKVFSKKGLKVAGATVTVGVAAHYIMEYINTNSGCFLKNGKTVVCKVRAYSCCQKDPIDNVPFCPEDSDRVYRDPCNEYDGDNDESCCKYCSCEHFDCSFGENMVCKRPTVAEALSFFTVEAASGIWSAITEVFPSINYIIYIVGFLVILWILSFFKNKFSKQDD